MSTPPLLRVEHLTTAFSMGGRRVLPLDDVSFEIRRGETLGLVGESGSGKSMTALSIIRLVPPPGRIIGGSIWLDGRDLLARSEREMRDVRGAQIALIFQEPMSALNPVFSIGDQIAEAMTVHGVPRAEAARRTLELLDAVRIPDPDRRVRDYPHQLSGGLRQRVLIAMALACRPALVIADEPTTALDATLQAEILQLLRDMREQFQLSLLLITHDLGIVARMADRVAVMYAGRLVEEAPVREIFGNPRHPYTRGLLASIPGGAPGRRLYTIGGSVPDPSTLPRGCAFGDRCADRFDACDLEPPLSTSIGPDHAVRCYLHDPRKTARRAAVAVPPGT